ncbi:unnamed protein product [Protopolystoma xenopodis]|uniref:Uncharacterized protein n=1 Tax=Protopolystoma xenopodis TaxID=117903 RepID=A0A3S5CNK8_9PLAT|nr:unnamed protein product [Protopolystoma xenopodis]
MSDCLSRPSACSIKYCFRKKLDYFQSDAEELASKGVHLLLTHVVLWRSAIALSSQLDLEQTHFDPALIPL